MVKISVIMPVYNAGEYLEESVNCILNQTFDDFELICVDDGSTDDSLEILNRFAQKDSRIQVYHQENNGGGAARNRALTYAKGQYLYCMDADDMIELDAFEKLYAIAEEKNLDFVIFQAIVYDDELDEYYHYGTYDMNELAEFVGDKVFSVDDLGRYILKMSVTPWCKFYNLDFVKKTGAQFAEGLIFHDNIFFWDILFNAERMYFLKEPLYIRRKHMKSSVLSKDKRHASTIAINNMIIQKFINHNHFDEYKKFLYNRKIHLAFRRYSEVKEEYKPYFYGVMKEDFTKMPAHERYPEFLKIVKPKQKQRFDMVVNSKDFDEFKKMYEKIELENDAKKKPSDDGFAAKFKKSIRKVFR